VVFMTTCLSLTFQAVTPHSCTPCIQGEGEYVTGIYYPFIYIYIYIFIICICYIQPTLFYTCLLSVRPYIHVYLHVFTFFSLLLRTTVIYTFIQSVREEATAPLHKGSNTDSLNLSTNTYTVFYTVTRTKSNRGNPNSASHNRIVLSPDPETIRLPSGENATEYTQRE
jgi:hypothetical protein